MELANKHIFALVTGASRGFGRSISDALLRAAAEQRAHRLALVLHARANSEATLNHVETHMMARYLTAQTGAIATALSITTLPLDLECEHLVDRAKRAIRVAMQALDAPVDHAFLFNNAAVLHPNEVGSDGFATGLADSLTVNVAAPALLSSVFLDAMPETSSRRIVLTSSLAAVQPFRSWAPYSTSKAAADMLHACIAAERPGVRVLCYAPGPMRTGMTGLQGTNHGATHGDLREMYDVGEMHRDNSFVDPDQSADKLIQLLLKDQFQSGQHIDFYDV